MLKKRANQEVHVEEMRSNVSHGKLAFAQAKADRFSRQALLVQRSATASTLVGTIII